MLHKKLALLRRDILLKPDCTRVLLLPFYPSRKETAQKIMDNVLSLSEKEVDHLVKKFHTDFTRRHKEIESLTIRRYEQVAMALNLVDSVSHQQKILIGSYFLMEYAFSSAALFNPSIVPHPDQTGIPLDSLRFILSLRATGEGHISSIAFLTGVIDEWNAITVDKQSPFVMPAERVTTDALSLSNYEVHFDPKMDFSERVLFPGSPSQCNGIEDARFVRFVDDDGEVIYYATFNAYNGTIAVPELIETKDFNNIKFSSLQGLAIRNKGMSLFPRKINGKYAMLSRPDDENIFIMFSDDIHNWSESSPLLSPAYPWEYMKIGTCGSPIETKYGWLVISHGVGSVRKYSIGAFFLDLMDPTRVIARMAEPLITPVERERNGYVPNVVYSCGAIVHHNELILPYGTSDSATRFASVNLDELVSFMVR